MIWHKTYRGDFPEDYKELVNDKREILVLVVDGKKNYDVELREYVEEYGGWSWHSRRRDIEAWTPITPYK